MKKRALFIIMLITSAAFAQDLPKIAVYVTGDINFNEKNALATDILASLVKSGRYRGIERSGAFLAQVGKEMTKQRSGDVDDDQISALGRQFGVKYVCIAAIIPAFGSNQISARIIDVETAEVVLIGVAYSPLRMIDDFTRASDKVVESLFEGQNAPKPKPAPILPEPGPGPKPAAPAPQATKPEPAPAAGKADAFDDFYAGAKPPEPAAQTPPMEEYVRWMQKYAPGQTPSVEGYKRWLQGLPPEPAPAPAAKQEPVAPPPTAARQEPAAPPRPTPPAPAPTPPAPPATPPKSQSSWGWRAGVGEHETLVTDLYVRLGISPRSRAYMGFGWWSLSDSYELRIPDSYAYASGKLETGAYHIAVFFERHTGNKVANLYGGPGLVLGFYNANYELSHNYEPLSIQVSGTGLDFGAQSGAELKLGVLIIGADARLAYRVCFWDGGETTSGVTGTFGLRAGFKFPDPKRRNTTLNKNGRK